MTSVPSTSGRPRTRVGALALGLLLALPPAVWQEARSQTVEAPGVGVHQTLPTWFRHAQSVLAAWHVAPIPGDALRVSVTPRHLRKDEPRRKIMVLYPRASSAYDIAISKMLSVFESKALPVELDIVNFQNDPVLGQASLRKARDGNAELIVAMGSESAAWLWENYRGGELPVVTVCSKDPVLLGQAGGYDEATGTNFAFTSLNVPIDVQMAYVAQIKPNLKAIAVISDSANVSAVETQVKPLLEFGKAHGLTVLDLAVQDASRSEGELARLVADARDRMAEADPDLRSSVFWITGSTSLFGEIATINANAGRAAVLSVVPDVVRSSDDSAMLSIGIGFESNAQLAALYASDVLTGRSRIGDLKVGVVSPPDIAINFRKLRQIGATVPLPIFSAAGTIYDYDGRLVRSEGQKGIPAGR